MADTYITSSIVLAEALDTFKNNLRFGNAVHRTDAVFKGNMPKIGESFQIENPWRFEVQDGPTIDVADNVETSVTVAITAHKVVPIRVLTRDKTMKIHNFRKKYLDDAMIKLANQVDSDLAGLYVDIGQTVGTAGTTPSAYLTVGAAAAKLDDMACPPGNRQLVLNPIASYTMADAVKGLHNPKMVEEYIKEGKLTDLIGMGGLYSSQNVKGHTLGAANDNAFVINDTPAEGDESLTIGTGTGAIAAGDTFTIAGVYKVNPVSYEQTGVETADLMEFVSTSAQAANATTLEFSPPLRATGATQNIAELPSNTDAITFKASHKANLAFHKTAFTLATVPFDLPETAPVKEQLTADGIVMTLTGGWDVTNYREVYRLDILYAVKTLRPEWAVRVMG